MINVSPGNHYPGGLIYRVLLYLTILVLDTKENLKGRVAKLENLWGDKLLLISS